LPFDLENLRITDNSPNKLGWFSNKSDSPLQSGLNASGNSSVSEFNCTQSIAETSNDGN